MTQEREEIATIRLCDERNNEVGVVIITRYGSKIGICISDLEDGDAEAWLTLIECQHLIEVLQEAISRQESIGD